MTKPMRQWKGCGKMDDLVKRLRANGLDECDEAIDRIEALEARIAKADALAEQVQRVKDFRYDPNIGIELNHLEESLAAYREGSDT